MLASYHAVVVKEGQIELQEPVQLPEGTEVLVVVALSETHRRKAFDEYIALAEKYPAEADIDTLSDQELVDIVHQVREERLRESGH